MKNGGTLLKWLETTALRAIDRWKLPAWQHPDLSLERVSSLWNAGVRNLEEIDLPSLADYPENGLFFHPLVERFEPRRLLPAGFAA
jgi:hypothetical protein